MRSNKRNGQSNIAAIQSCLLRIVVRQAFAVTVGGIGGRHKRRAQWLSGSGTPPEFHGIPFRYRSFSKYIRLGRGLGPTGDRDGENVMPTIISDGGGATASVALAEDRLGVTRVVAIDNNPTTITYSIVGGADQFLFQINATTGLLAFVGVPNFEAPA